MTMSSRILEFLPRGFSRFALPIIVAGFVILALFSPTTTSTRSFDPRLSSRLSGPNGAQGLYDVAGELGWKTQRRNTNPFDSIESGTIIAELAPPIRLSERETSILLKRVRDGASLLTVIERDTPLADSLGLDVNRALVIVPIDPPANLECSGNEPRGAYPFAGKKASLRPFSEKIRRSPDYRIFGMATNPDMRQWRYAAIGFPMGKGRVVAISDPNFLRNDFLRVCRWGLGVLSIRMLEYLTAEKSRESTRFVFDEFHQGFGPQPSVTRAAGMLLFNTPWGYLILQVIAASIVLLLAIAPRPIPPAPAPNVQRRSQFEHVEALSSAYQQISASRLVIETLLRGVQRRVGKNSLTFARHAESDEHFLDRVASSHPSIASDVGVVSAALKGDSSPSQLLHAVAAIETIERTIKR